MRAKDKTLDNGKDRDRSVWKKKPTFDHWHMFISHIYQGRLKYTCPIFTDEYKTKVDGAQATSLIDPSLAIKESAMLVHGHICEPSWPSPFTSLSKSFVLKCSILTNKSMFILFDKRQLAHLAIQSWSFNWFIWTYGCLYALEITVICTNNTSLAAAAAS